MIWKVAGSGFATMSGSCMRVKPWMDEPSKPMPSEKAPSSSLGLMAKLFGTPRISVNQILTTLTLFIKRNYDRKLDNRGIENLIFCGRS